MNTSYMSLRQATSIVPDNTLYNSRLTKADIEFYLGNLSIFSNSHEIRSIPTESAQFINLVGEFLIRNIKPELVNRLKLGVKLDLYNGCFITDIALLTSNVINLRCSVYRDLDKRNKKAYLIECFSPVLESENVSKFKAELHRFLVDSDLVKSSKPVNVNLNELISKLNTSPKLSNNLARAQQKRAVGRVLA